MKRPHRVLSRDDIMDLLKGHDWSPLDRSIDNLVARLRKKVETDPDRPALIKTVRGVGYTFTADVARQGLLRASRPGRRPALRVAPRPCPTTPLDFDLALGFDRFGLLGLQ